VVRLVKWLHEVCTGGAESEEQREEGDESCVGGLWGEGSGQTRVRRRGFGSGFGRLNASYNSRLLTIFALIDRRNVTLERDRTGWVAVEHDCCALAEKSRKIG
jgi:hypothetical protein